jgi:glycosyltransferase involved in cell wall biosynthesis
MTDFLSQLVNRRETKSSIYDVSSERQSVPSDLSQADELVYTPEVLDGIKYIIKSGLFDTEFYFASYPDVATAGVDPFNHFFHYGFREGRCPNPYFEPLWYLDTNADVRDVQAQPLMHYVLIGDKEGRRPSLKFDTAWYRRNYDVASDDNALAHYLNNRGTGRFSPVPDFDVGFYLKDNPDIAAAGVDPFEHFISYGYRERRNPSAEFDVTFYTQRYLSGDTKTNPFLHYLAHKHEPGVYGRMPDEEATVWREVKRFTKPGPEFENFRPLSTSAERQFKLLVYYLPQFHAIPENDAWWGKGFTEWSNIARGIPRFKGHYQPRVPRDLGFYSLDSIEPMRKQAEMARAAGVHGFVFYYYWFNGQRLLEQPIRRFLDDRSIDIPFSLMWANENWTRRWDGAESEVLISQDYRPNDDERMAAEFARHFQDPRYIRIQGRPLLMIYRPGLIPEPAKTVRRWREIFKTQHGEDPILIMAQSFMDADPIPYGMDGAIEFPPHKLTQHMPPINASLEYFDSEFTGHVYRYDEVVRTSLGEPPPEYPLIKTAVPNWDNDARRQGTGLSITDSSPAKYEHWLGCLGEIARKNLFFGEPIVCVNAWNEWCEGAYLEPDLHYGSAYLNATARAVAGLSRRTAVPRLLLIGHDAFPSGAQQNLLAQGRVLRHSFGVDIQFLLLEGGKLEDAYHQVGPMTVASSEATLRVRLKTLAGQGFTYAIINTTAASHVLPLVRAAGIDPIVLVHELPHIIREKNLIAGARAALQARLVLFAAAFVRDELLTVLGVESTEGTLILPQGSYKAISYSSAAGAGPRAEFGLTERDKLVIGVGYADMRKGFDLFLQLWRLLRAPATGKRRGRVCLVWIGDIDPGLKDWLGTEIADAEATGTFRMAGYRDDMGALFSAADAFALTSREDPFPTVVLEALSAGLPVVAFDRSGGIPDMLRETRQGVVVPYGDLTAMAASITAQLNVGITDRQRAERHALITERFSFKTYVRRLMELALPGLPSVSVVVPNYNYARHLPLRLGTVFAQSHPVREIIVLDDASTDDSAMVIPALAEQWGREIQFVANETNSGSVFAQWRRAAELASGEFIWLAEADDAAEQDFLVRTLALLSSDPAIQFAFTDSRTIDADGAPQWESYKSYYSSVEAGALTHTEVFEAKSFVQRFLSVKNLILNVSSVVWRRDALLRALEACQADLRTLRMAGDWRLYLEALALPGAKVAYEAEPLNVHRRHATSVTHALTADRHVQEIARCHEIAAREFALPGSVARKQAEYVVEVTQQLGARGSKPEAAERPAGKEKRERGRRNPGARSRGNRVRGKNHSANKDIG